MYDDKDTYFLPDSQFLLIRNIVNHEFFSRRKMFLFMKKNISFHENNYLFS